MRITGIICPCRQELEPFLRLTADLEQVRIKKLIFFTGNIGAAQVVLCSSGIGKVNSAAAAQIMADRFEVEAIIVSGTAGSTDGRAGLLDTVICDTAVYHDLVPAALQTENPHMSEAVFHADRSLTSHLSQSGYIFGRMASGDVFADSSVRLRIAEKTGAVCADMETAAVAHCCFINDIPFTAVRTITDTPEYGGIKTCLANLDRAAELSAAAVAEILGHDKI